MHFSTAGSTQIRQPFASVQVSVYPPRRAKRPHKFPTPRSMPPTSAMHLYASFAHRSTAGRMSAADKPQQRCVYASFAHCDAASRMSSADVPQHQCVYASFAHRNTAGRMSSANVPPKDYDAHFAAPVLRHCRSVRCDTYAACIPGTMCALLCSTSTWSCRKDAGHSDLLPSAHAMLHALMQDAPSLGTAAAAAQMQCRRRRAHYFCGCQAQTTPHRDAQQSDSHPRTAQGTAHTSYQLGAVASQGNSRQRQTDPFLFLCNRALSLSRCRPDSPAIPVVATQKLHSGTPSHAQASGYTQHDS